LMWSIIESALWSRQL